MKELEHTGFFASKTIGVDFDPLQAMNNYGMCNEQEKCFALQKGPLRHDRLRTPGLKIMSYSNMIIIFERFNQLSPDTLSNVIN